MQRNGFIQVEDLKGAIQKKQNLTSTEKKRDLDPRLQYYGTNNKRPGPALEPSIYQIKQDEER